MVEPLQPVLISAIEHYSYCPRQCGLIHVESIFDENLLTIRGGRAHERVHSETARSERGKTVLRGLPLWSERYGLVGKADAVEFLPLQMNGGGRGSSPSLAQEIHQRPEKRMGAGKFVPIEYKVGRNTGHRHALYQACAQALCLEEMFGREVTEAAVYYIGSRERTTFPLDQETRQRTFEIIEEIRAMQARGVLPEPVADKRCPKCSLIDACMPFAVRIAAASKPNLFEPLPEGFLP